MSVQPMRPAALRMCALVAISLAGCVRSGPSPGRPRDLHPAATIAAVPPPTRASAVTPPRFPALIPVEPHATRGRLGAPFSWTYYYDRNALVASQLVGVHLVATTEAGHLLVFDTDSVSLTGEALSPRVVTCLGPAIDGSILVGFADGLVGRVTIPGFEVTEVARVSGRPLWIGAAKAANDTVVVYADAHGGAGISTAWGRSRTHTVRMLGSGHEMDVPDASSFLMDDRDQLWLGVDHGEFGGGLYRVDLLEDRMEAVLPDNVLGISRIQDEIWAYGGLAHLTGFYSFIARVAPGKPKRLRERSGFIDQKPRDPRLGPSLPISQIVEAGTGVSIWSGTDIFQANRSLGGWKRLRDPTPSHIDGRRWRRTAYYPVNDTSTVVDDRVFRPTGTGFLELEDGTASRHPISGEIPIAPTRLVASATDLIVGGTGQGFEFRVEPGWGTAEGRWLEPATTPSVATHGWCDSGFFAAPDGTIRVAAKWGPTSKPRSCTGGDGILITGAIQGGAFREISREQSKLDVRAMGLLPDGRLVGMDQDRSPLIHDNGAFRPAPEGPWRAAFGADLGARRGGRLVLSTGLCELVMEHGVPRLSLFPTYIDGLAPEIFDGLRLSEDVVLLATDRGLCSYDLNAKSCSRFEPIGMQGIIERFVRDDAGRIWMGGHGLYLLTALNRAVAVHPFLPFFEDATVTDLAVTGGRLAVALRNRGLLFLDPSEVARVLAPTRRG